MTLSHDPRPASRYQAVTPSAYRDQLGRDDRPAMAAPAPAGGPRVLRHVQARLLRLAIGD